MLFPSRYEIFGPRNSADRKHAEREETRMEREQHRGNDGERDNTCKEERERERESTH